VGGQSLARTVRRPAAARENVEPVVRPHPQPAVATLAQGQHRRAEQDRAPRQRREAAPREEGNLSPAGPDPQATARRGRDRIDVLVGQPLRSPIGEHGAVLDLHEPDTPHPRPSLAVFEGGAARVGAEAVLPGQELHRPVPHAMKGAVGADPDTSLTVGEEAPDVGVAQRDAVRHEAAAGEAVEPVAVGADPEAAGGVDGQGAHRRRALPRRQGEALEHRGPPPEAGRGPDPDAAVAISEKAPDGIVDETVLLRKAREGPVVEPVEPVAVGADPEVAPRVLGEGADRRRGEPLAARVGAERTVPIAEQPAAVDADPQRPVARHVDRLHVVGAHGRRRPAVEDREAHAVEPRQAFLRGQPQVAVGRLGDRLHQVVGERGVDLPCGQAELAHGLARLERHRRGSAQQEQSSQHGNQARDTARVHVGHRMLPAAWRVAHRGAGFKRGRACGRSVLVFGN